MIKIYRTVIWGAIITMALEAVFQPLHLIDCSFHFRIGPDLNSKCGRCHKKLHFCCPRLVPLHPRLSQVITLEEFRIVFHPIHEFLPHCSIVVLTSCEVVTETTKEAIPISFNSDDILTLWSGYHPWFKMDCSRTQTGEEYGPYLYRCSLGFQKRGPK